MSVKVVLFPERRTQSVKLAKGADGFQLLKAININPENVIIMRGSRPIPVDSRIRPDDELKVIRVVSGG